MAYEVVCLFQGRPCGKAKLEKQGLWWKIRIECSLPAGKTFRRAVLICGNSVLHVGTLVPDGAVFARSRSFSGNELSGIGVRIEDATRCEITEDGAAGPYGSGEHAEGASHHGAAQDVISEKVPAFSQNVTQGSGGRAGGTRRRSAENIGWKKVSPVFVHCADAALASAIAGSPIDLYIHTGRRTLLAAPLGRPFPLLPVFLLTKPVQISGIACLAVGLNAKDLPIRPDI